MIPSTRESLLVRMRDPGNTWAWQEFYELYGRLILNFAIKRGCSYELAEDVLQEVMIGLFQAIPRFAYDRERGRFRSFLFTIVQRTMSKCLRRERKHTNPDGSDARTTDWFARIPAPEAEDWQSSWDRDWDQHILLQALERVKQRVAHGTFESFCEVVLKGRAVAEVSADLGISVDTIYQHRKRMTDRLRREVPRVVAELQ